MPLSTQNRFRHLASICAALGLALAACDKSPTSPRPQQQPGPPPVTPVTAVRLELVAPEGIAPGESVQLTANAVKSNGSVENVSNQTEWSTGNSNFLQLSSTGLATGKAPAEVWVSGRFASQAATARIFVLPTGTFRLKGTIRESGFGIANVRVTVISGVGAGLTELTDRTGSYALYGVSGPVQIQLKKDGYLNGTPQIDVGAHGTRDFELAVERPRKDYTGTYTLTISAASPCRNTFGLFPEAAKRRVYTANVAQDVGRLTVTLTDADFIVSNGYGNRFYGFIDPNDAITFLISDDYYYSGNFDVVERLGNTALLINGTVSARGIPALIAGTLEGSILISRSSSPPFSIFSFSSQCDSNRHGFEMALR